MYKPESVPENSQGFSDTNNPGQKGMPSLS